MYIPVLVLLALVLGAALGAWRAKRRGGKGLDMAQYAAAHAAKGAAFTPNATLNWDLARNYIAILPPGQQPKAAAPAPAAPAKGK